MKLNIIATLALMISVALTFLFFYLYLTQAFIFGRGFYRWYLLGHFIAFSPSENLVMWSENGGDDTGDERVKHK